MSEATPAQRMLGRPAEPGLESTLVAARLGAASPAAALEVVAVWPLLTLCHPSSEPGTHGIDPLIVRSPDGEVSVAAWTSPDRIRDAPSAMVPRWVRGATLASGLRGGAGIVINPASEPTFRVTPADVGSLLHAPASPPAQPPGSRALTELEYAIIRVLAGAGERDSIVTALADTQVLVVSETDPAVDGIDVATTLSRGRRSLLVWTDEALVRDVPASAYLVRVHGTDLGGLLGDMHSVRIDPGTAFDSEIVASEIISLAAPAAR